jgi:hypothetical protein
VRSFVLLVRFGWSLLSSLVGPVLVVVPLVLGEDLALAENLIRAGQIVLPTSTPSAYVAGDHHGTTMGCAVRLTYLTCSGDLDGCRSQLSRERGWSVDRGRAPSGSACWGVAVRRTYVAAGLAMVWPGAWNVTGVMVVGR